MTSIWPLLVIFGTDFTLWPFWAEHEVSFPFITVDGKPADKSEEAMEETYYPEIPAIFETLKNAGVQIAIATHVVFKSYNITYRELFKLYDWEKYFSYIEIQPGNITEHVKNIHEKSKVPLDKMIFFGSNATVDPARDLGLMVVAVDSPEEYESKGMNMEILDAALKEYDLRQRKKNTE